MQTNPLIEQHCNKAKYTANEDATQNDASFVEFVQDISENKITNTTILLVMQKAIPAAKVNLISYTRSPLKSTQNICPNSRTDQKVEDHPTSAMICTKNTVGFKENINTKHIYMIWWSHSSSDGFTMALQTHSYISKAIFAIPIPRRTHKQFCKTYMELPNISITMTQVYGPIEMKCVHAFRMLPVITSYTPQEQFLYLGKSRSKKQCIVGMAKEKNIKLAHVQANVTWKKSMLSEQKVDLQERELISSEQLSHILFHFKLGY
eukprot:TRINITY_DN10621_c0_g3_i1.p2 TRINITY_DN10621_c0_g3~~TRINITY_DN10621_c0_g3_i1.p2  ORF type:complete len:263 (+),score=3.85 TRINITY_DN10621_c0_g3_i1:1215-2003(+)